MGVCVADIDNDGLLDIFAANGHVYPEIDRSGRGTTFLQRKQLFQNTGNRGGRAGAGRALTRLGG